MFSTTARRNAATSLCSRCPDLNYSATCEQWECNRDSRPFLFESGHSFIADMTALKGFRMVDGSVFRVLHIPVLVLVSVVILIVAFNSNKNVKMEGC